MIVQTGLFSNETHQSKGKRVESDYYPTPEMITNILLSHNLIENKIILEPCCGCGAISSILGKCNKMLSTDIENIDKSIPRDATTQDFWDYWSIDDYGDRIDWVVTNPPFNVASKILPFAYERSQIGVAFLLRLSYLEPAQDRAQWLKDHADNMRCMIPLNPRPQFRRDTKGTDSSTVFWGIWRKDWSWERLGVESPFQFEWGWR